MTEQPSEVPPRYMCTGFGDRGDHCCYIKGVVCKFLNVQPTGRPLCSLWYEGTMIGNPEWEEAPVGQFMAERYPGYDCHDWPQAIPSAMQQRRGLCCYQEVVYVVDGIKDVIDGLTNLAEDITDIVQKES